MKGSIVLVMFATSALLACSKTDETAAPAPEAPAISAPAAVEAPVAETPAAADPAMTEPAAPADPAPSAAPAQPAPAPAAKPAAPAAPAAPKATTPPEAAPAAPAAPKADLARGEQVYRQSCAVCHANGVAGAPKTGDAAAWAPRIARGIDALYATAINGKGAMPAKGGNPSLSDADVKAAVDYLVAQSR